MAKFISVPQKRTSDVDLVKPLGQLLTTYYGGDQTHQTEALENLDKLRKDATIKGIEGKSMTTLSALQRYYDQLKRFTDKCPIDDVPINFKWKDSFERASYIFLPGSSTSQIIQSMAYERLCVLFNLAACYSETASTLLEEDVHNDHALQIAAKHFQIAAGIFSELKNDVPGLLGQRCFHLDFNPGVLNVLHYLMLAQAQEAICIKASGMSDTSLAKVAAQCSNYYDECYKLIQLVKGVWPNKEWQNHIHSKHLCYQAVSDYHRSASSRNNKKYGDEISFLQHAIENFEKASAKSLPSDFLVQYQKKIARRCEEAVKENNFIYHARVPDYNLLDPVESFSLVNPVPVASKFSTDSSLNLFEDLLPLKVQHFMQKLDARKQEIVNNEVSTLELASKEFNSMLAALNLPASLEDAPGVDLPQSLKDKSKYLRNKGGAQYVAKLIAELPELLKRNTEILNEIEKTIANEERQDDEYRAKYGKKWTRQPSSRLNKNWKDHISKYNDTIKAAITADDKVKEKFKNSEREIFLLSSDSPQAIADAIPAGYQGHNCSNAPCVLKLRRLMIEVENLKKSRQELEEKIKNADFEPIKKRFMGVFSGGESQQVNEAAQIGETIAEVFGPLERAAKESLEEQKRLVLEIQLTNDDFVELRGATRSGEFERDRFLSRLAQAYDTYNELLTHLQEGSKFYNDLTVILVGVQAKVDDYVYSRRIEAEEIIKKVGDVPANSFPKQQASNPSAPEASYPAYFPPPPLPNMPHSYNTY